MAAIQTFSFRHQALLTSLLNNRAGLSVDQLAQEIGISRNATNQHLSGLTNLGLIEHSLRPSSGGRPVNSHSLTPAGLELFPRHYALLSSLLIDWIRSHLDQQALTACLQELGIQLAAEYARRVDSFNSLPLKISEVAVILDEMGYRAGTYTEDDGASGEHGCAVAAAELVGSERKVGGVATLAREVFAKCRFSENERRAIYRHYESRTRRLSGCTGHRLPDVPTEGDTVAHT